MPSSETIIEVKHLFKVFGEGHEAGFPLINQRTDP
jgi:hypothetical protein